MSDAPPREPAPNPASPVEAVLFERSHSPRARRQLRFQILAVVTLGTVPAIWASLAGRLLDVPATRDHWGFQEGNLTAHSLAVVLPLLVIMRLSRRPWAYYSIVPFRIGLDLVMSVVVAAGMWASSIMTHRILSMPLVAVPEWTTVVTIFPPNDHRIAAPDPATFAPLWALSISMLANGFAEELVRAYLLPRLRELWGSAVWSVLAVSGLFAIYHLYQGSYAAMVIFGSEIFSCVLLLVMKRVWPLAVGHALYDVAIYTL